MRNENGVAILGSSGTYGDESASLENLIESTAIHHKVLDDRESRTSERFHGDGGSVLEMTHEKLAGSHMIVRSMCTSVNVEGACSADTFTAVMVE